VDAQSFRKRDEDKDEDGRLGTRLRTIGTDGDPD